MVGAIRNSLSYIVASPFTALWQKFGDKMGDQGLSLAEVEGPYCIFGGAFSLYQSCGWRMCSDRESTRGSFPSPEVLHELRKTHNVSFRPGSRHFYRRLLWGTTT
jgi:hypothetical protein